MKDITLLLEKMKMTLTEAKGAEAFAAVLGDIATFYSDVFGLRKDEVAILLANQEKTVLSFACPDYLVNSGLIPVSSPDAFASQIFRLGRGIIENNFNQVKHLHLFEYVRVGEGKKTMPIWKIMGSLLKSGEEKIGVIELSRKAPAPEETGDDFTPEQLEFLDRSIAMLTPFLVKTMPGDFRGKLT